MAISRPASTRWQAVSLSAWTVLGQGVTAAAGARPRLGRARTGHWRLDIPAVVPSDPQPASGSIVADVPSSLGQPARDDKRPEPAPLPLAATEAKPRQVPSWIGSYPRDGPSRQPTAAWRPTRQASGRRSLQALACGQFGCATAPGTIGRDPERTESTLKR